MRDASAILKSNSDKAKPGSMPAKPRTASTVILVRDETQGLQVYLLKRNPQSGFFPGLYVFPGGAVGSQDSDAQFWSLHSDVPRADLAARFGTAMSEEEVLAHCVSAVRETFEEAGIFLGAALPSEEERLEGMRKRRLTSEGLPTQWLRDEAVHGSCVLGLSMLAPWSHWITPEAMPKRFDTRFWVAFMPGGQTCSPDGSETVHGVWMNPDQALARNLEGEIPLSPPTLVTLHQLLPYAHAEDLRAALKERSWGEPILPRFIPFSNGAMIVEPWDPMYDRELELGQDLESAVLPPGKPFSRIWFHKGRWRPVGMEEAQCCAHGSSHGGRNTP